MRTMIILMIHVFFTTHHTNVCRGTVANSSSNSYLVVTKYDNMLFTIMTMSISNSK